MEVEQPVSLDAAASEIIEPIQDAFEEGSEEDSFEEDFEGEEDGSEDAEASEKEKKELEKEIKRLKKLTIKYNGKEYEEELPFEIDDNPESVEWMKRQLQLAKLSQTKSQSYSQLENEVKDFIEELRKNPRKALANPNIGVDLKQLAAEVLNEEIENSRKTPEQIEKEKLETRLKELEEEREAEKEELRQREFERQLNQEYERYDILMDKALETSNLPKSPYIVKKMADYMILGIQNGLKVEPADVLPIVEEEMRSDLKEMFSVMPADVINQLLGNDNYDKVRKYRLSKARGGKKAGKKNPAVDKKAKDIGKITDSKGKKEEKSVTFKDFFGV